MARRKDDPLLQAAKGFPGRRKAKVLQEIEQAAEASERQAEVPGNPFPLPEAFTGAPVYWKRAIALWEQQAEVLRTAGRRRPGYRAALTRYCIWTQLFEKAAETLRRDLPKGGLTIKWEMGHGATKVVPHPSLDIMKDAESVLRLIESEFGFTPRGDSDLTRVESFNAAQGKFPLGGAAPGQRSPERHADGPADAQDPMSLMSDSDGIPPGQRPN
jgi:phage terminase small subunit